MAEEFVECSAVRVSSKGICEMQGKRVGQFIPLEHILTVKLVYGRDARRPFLQLMFGLIFIVVPFFLGWRILTSAVDEGAYKAIRIFGALFLFIPLGIWLLFDLVHRRFYFKVKTTDGDRTVRFRSGAQAEEINKFIDAANKYIREIEIMR